MKIAGICVLLILSGCTTLEHSHDGGKSWSPGGTHPVADHKSGKVVNADHSATPINTGVTWGSMHPAPITVILR